MVLLWSRLSVLVICSFSFGTWVGFYWRKSVGGPVGTSSLKPKHVESLSNGKSLRNEVAVYYQKDIKSDHGNDVCMPQQNVMFLKTHKTASSAVQNILLRYAHKQNLVVGLSNTNDIRFRYASGKKFMKEYVASTTRPVNMLCHHMVFNLPEVQKVMPKDSTYVTILREPGSLFESMFDYFHFDSTPFKRIKKGPNSLEMWLNHTSVFFRGKGDGTFWWFAKNGIFFDMGYDNLNDDDIYIQNAITELDEAFDLVLLADYFPESMLLLKDHLCWTMDDILVLKTNARGSAGTDLKDGVRKRIRQWNKADAAIYDHFNETFWKKVAEYGLERMESDLKLLEEMDTQLQDECVEGGAVSNKFIKLSANKVYNPRGVEMKGYNIKESAKNNPNCVNLLKGEIQWTREMMAKAKFNAT